MSKAQYNREEEAGRIDKHAIYITPDEEINLTPYATINYVDMQDYNNSASIQKLQNQMNTALEGKSNTTHTHDGRYYTQSEIDTKLSGKANSSHNHSASAITSGTLSFDRLSTVPIAKGGTGATTAAGALKNLGVTATAAELNYVDGVTSNIQTQINSKQAAITGGATTITSSNLTANRALVSNGSGKVAVSAVTSTELGYLDGVTSNIQAQLDSKSASGHQHWYLQPSNGGANTVMLSGDGYLYPYANEGQQLGTTDRKWSYIFGKYIVGSAEVNAPKINATTGVYVNGTACSLNGHQHWYLQPPNGGANTVMLTNGGNVYPYVNKGQQLGTSTNKWSYILCQDCQEESDIRLKDKFDTNIDSYVNMLDLINPTSYLFKSDIEKGINKRNVGYIAQEVQEALHKVGLKDSDFAGLFYDEEEEKNGAYTYSLAYSQFIPILHAKVKQLEEKYNAKIEEYDAKIAELNEKLAALTV